MQLRRSITIPSRLEDEQQPTPQTRKTSKPAFPKVLQSQVVAYDPNNSAAAFPSRPLTATSSAETTTVYSTNGHAAPDMDKDVDVNNAALDLHIHATDTLQRAEREQVQEIDEMDLNDLSEDDDIIQSVEANEQPPKVAIAHGPRPTALTIQPNDEVSWSSLSMALQYHLYKELAFRSSHKEALEQLGLSRAEELKLQRIVGDRAIYPATVAEIWAVCISRGGQEEEGQPAAPANADLLRVHLDYMIFSSNYECAYEADVRRAVQFVHDRGIPRKILGAWFPDPSNPIDDQYLRHVPGRLIMARPAKPAAVTATQNNDSGYSSMSDVQVMASKRAAAKKTRNSLPAVGNREAARLLPPWQPRPHPFLNGRPQALRTLSANITSTPPRHPLATISKPGNSSSPAQNSITEARSHVSALPAHPSNTSASRPADDMPPPPSQPVAKASQRLVMKVQPADGLAIVSRKTTTQDSISGIATVSAPTPAANVFGGLPFGNQQSSFSRGLLMPDTASAMPGSTINNTFANAMVIPPVRHTSSGPVVAPIHLMASAHRLSVSSISVPNSTKRKSSQSDVRPEPGKVIRTATTGMTPIRPILSTVSDIGESHTMAKSSNQIIVNETASDPITPTKGAPLTASNVNNAPGSPPPPNFSPISENGDRDETHKLLESPRYKKRLDIQIPTPVHSQAVTQDSGDLPTPDSATFAPDNQSQLATASTAVSGADPAAVKAGALGSTESLKPRRPLLKLNMPKRPTVDDFMTTPQTAVPASFSSLTPNTSAPSSADASDAAPKVRRKYNKSDKQRAKETMKRQNEALRAASRAASSITQAT